MVVTFQRTVFECLNVEWASRFEGMLKCTQAMESMAIAKVVKVLPFTTIRIRWHQIPSNICSSLLWIREKRTCGIKCCVDCFLSSIFVVVGRERQSLHIQLLQKYPWFLGKYGKI